MVYACGSRKHILWYIAAMCLLSAFLKSIFADWIGPMSGVFGIFTALAAFWVETKAQLVIFVSLACLSFLLAVFSAWKKEYLKATQKVTLEIDSNKSRIIVHPQSDYPPVNGFRTVSQIKMDVRARFVNADIHPTTIRSIRAAMWERQRLRKAKLVGEWGVPVRDIPDDEPGVVIEARKVSTYYLYRWVLDLPEALIYTLEPNRYFVTIEMYSLGQHPFQVDLDVEWIDTRTGQLKLRDR
jgi:hypothetical protein